MPKEKQVKIEIELPEWIVKQAGTAGSPTRRVLEDELGHVAFTRLTRETKK